MKALAAVAVFFVLAGTATSSPPCAQIQHFQRQQVVAQPVYVQNGYTVQLQQAPAAYAYYSVSGALQEQALVEAISAKIIAKLSAAPQSLTNPATCPPGTGAAAWSPQDPGAVVLLQKCANCHKQTSKAVADNHSPVLFDSVGKWTGNRDAAIKGVTAAKLGAMPPGPAAALSDDDFLAVRAYFQKLYPQEAQK